MKSKARIKAASADQVPVGIYMPFGNHLRANVVQLRRTGDLVATWKLRGISFESRDEADIAAYKEGLINLLRGLGGGQVALWSHKIRRQVQERLNGVYDNGFAHKLAEDYYQTFDTHRQMRTELYLTVVYRPNTGKLPNIFGNLFGGQKRSLQEIRTQTLEALDGLEDVAQMVERALEPYRPERLTTYAKGEITCSGLLTFFGYLVNGVWEDIPLRHASRALLGKPNGCVCFGRGWKSAT